VGEPAARWTGIALVVAAVSPPVHAAADRSLAVHMVQHVLLLTVAPAMLVAGGVGRAVAARWRPPVVAAAAATTAIQTAVMVAWHLPPLYGAAHGGTAAHLAEHVLFLVSGTAFWAVVTSDDVGLAAPLVLFVASLPGTALGVALTLAQSAWYPAYPDMGSQQLAGVVMWAGAGTAYLVGAAASTVRAVST
jgi:putative membrane protein